MELSCTGLPRQRVKDGAVVNCGWYTQWAGGGLHLTSVSPSWPHYFFPCQGGREVSDFVSYLKREATYPPILQEDEKPKKKKKAPKEDL